jgi:hypothetical protein
MVSDGASDAAKSFDVRETQLWAPHLHCTTSSCHNEEPSQLDPVSFLIEGE